MLGLNNGSTADHFLVEAIPVIQIVQIHRIEDLALIRNPVR
jgi:hypothetical protein